VVSSCRSRIVVESQLRYRLSISHDVDYVVVLSWSFRSLVVVGGEGIKGY